MRKMNNNLFKKYCEKKIKAYSEACGNFFVLGLVCAFFSLTFLAAASFAQKTLDYFSSIPPLVSLALFIISLFCMLQKDKWNDILEGDC